MPSIKDPFTAITIISEICTDMSKFPTAKNLCSWAGLTPTNNESAGKKKSVRISKAGCYIKPLLVQCANAVVKSEKHPEFRNRYLRIKKRRGHKKAIIAICRMILTAIYHMFQTSELYNAQALSQSRSFTCQSRNYYRTSDYNRTLTRLSHQRRGCFLTFLIRYT